MRKFLAVVAVCIAVSMMSACSFNRASSAESTNTPVSKPTNKPKPPVTVAVPWQKGWFQEGIQIYWNTENANAKSDATRVLDYVVGLGANSVGISFPIYVDGATPTTAYAGPDTPSVKALQEVVRQAKIRKLRVMLRPVIDGQNMQQEDPTAWRGNFDPIVTKLWFESYRKLLSPYLVMAGCNRVDEFVIGTEMTSLQSSDEWKKVAQDAAKKLFRGKVSYTLNPAWGKKKPAVGHFGIDLYPSVKLSDDASILQITRALEKWIAKQQALLKTGLTIHEVALAGVSGSYLEPWNWSTAQGQPAPSMQSKWFAAAFQAAKKEGADGIYFWSLTSGQKFGKQLDVDKQPSGSYVDRPAEKTIRYLFSN